MQTKQASRFQIQFIPQVAQQHLKKLDHGSMEILLILNQEILLTLIFPQMALIAFLMSELLLRITKTGPYGVLKEILLETVKREAKETVEKPARNYVHTRKIKRM